MHGSEHRKNNDDAVTDREGKTAEDTGVQDSESDVVFCEIVQDTQAHCDGDNESIQFTSSLLSEAVTSESAKYDVEKYGSALSYDHHCFYIDGRPTWILAADFDYWQLPMSIALSADSEKEKHAVGITEAARDTWKHALLQLKALGFNAVRICFHWDFYLPSKGKYGITESRDVNLLLPLCKELGILAIACRDHIRLRHLWRSEIELWDDRFAAAEAMWFDNIIPLLVEHKVVKHAMRFAPDQVIGLASH